MFFRRRARDSHEQRLRALGRLLDERRYERDGLCIIAVGDGFAVSGLRVPARGAAYDLALEEENVSAEELAALIGRLRD
jgi:hypothetical protein